MKPVNPKCSDCGASMEAGFLADHAQSGFQQSRWVKGGPEKNWLAGVKVKGKAQYAVEACRCQRCGLVKLYAS